jgi:RimJ/RimL family protein N-acetyltransferase
MDPAIDGAPPRLHTARLLLRSLTEADVDPLARLSSDPETMRFFDALPTREQIEALVERHRTALAEGRPGQFAVERLEDGRFLGFVGLAVPRFEASFQPCVEIGWRLGKDSWGHGYATEAGRAVLVHAFETLGLSELVSFTAVLNEPSQAVMRRLGMRRDPDGDFDHPVISPGHPLRPHVLYRLTAEEWSRTRFGP